ncbi:MAG: nucleotidyltransferase [Ruminococcaceae bacterium]|nr:nucleotidyltransferase [Oscillospiraceae bacterium]
MNTTLVVMAAGMGSRFGGLKQMEPIGPKGEVLLDFSVYDAKKAGFNKVVFIIKEEIEKDFKEIVGKKIEKLIDVDYVMQDMSILPEGRKKPFGTSHAILCCKDAVKEPFAVINADDYYGANAFYEIHNHLVNAKDFDFCMVAYELDKTLSENGTVARGICDVKDGYLKDVVERTKINSQGQFTEDEQSWTQLPMDSKVSMNLWGFTPALFGELEKEFDSFLKTADLQKDECLIPSMVDKLVKNCTATVKVYTNKDKWYGITYREDKEAVQAAIKEFCDQGLYN